MSILAKNNDPLWFKDAIIYEVSVRAFYDSNGDGIGDFQGLIRKLDYLEDLGINTIWLLPFFPSPLKDDGFDVSEYCDVHADYGTLSDFKQFLKDAHARGIRVITELVLNHTSDQHPWFKRSRKAKSGSRYRDYYVWRNIRKPASCFPPRRPAIGHGIRRRKHISGTDSTAINRSLILTTRKYNSR
jgi:maltose alpha-D-glucosyltransferase/alpha-amylase